MSRLHYDLVADRKTADLELDVFTRILTGQIYDNEEVRMDKPESYNNGFEYCGVAELGSDPSLPVWNCIRCTWMNNRKVRMQYRSNIIWNNRSGGWLL